MRASASYTKAYYRLGDQRNLDLLIKRKDQVCDNPP